MQLSSCVCVVGLCRITRHSNGSLQALCVCVCVCACVSVSPPVPQSQLPGQRTYTSTLQALTHIYTHEGPKALYRGFLPKALRLGIGQTIGLMMFKSCLSAFGVRETD